MYLPSFLRDSRSIVSMASSPPPAISRPSYFAETRFTMTSPKVVGVTALSAEIEQPEQLEPCSQMSGGEASEASACSTRNSPSSERPSTAAERVVHIRKSRLVNIRPPRDV